LQPGVDKESGIIQRDRGSISKAWGYLRSDSVKLCEAPHAAIDAEKRVEISSAERLTGAAKVTFCDVTETVLI
jgi:hypothetical protein